MNDSSMYFELHGLSQKSNYAFKLFVNAWLSDFCVGEFVVTEDHGKYIIVFSRVEDLLIAKIKDLPPYMKKYTK